MSRKIVISDIHGCCSEFKSLLEKVQYNPTHDQLILLGDYIDRGKENKEVLNYICSLVYEGTIALKGNHDRMFLDWLSHPVLNMPNYFRNGGLETIRSLLTNTERDILSWDTYLKWADQIKEKYNKEIEMLNNLPYFYEDDEHIYVHAGINPFLKNWKETKAHELLWIREPFLNHDHTQDKTVIHGHTPTPNFQQNGEIIFGRNKINIDGGCAYGYQLNCLIIEGSEYDEFSVKIQNN